MNILLDCDGVLADFVSASLRAHGRSHLGHDSATHWNYFDDWGITAAQFWAPIHGYDFWYGLDPYPWAKKLLADLRRIGDVTILTAPSNDPECPQAKIEWLRDKMGVEMKDVIVGSKKHLLAGQNSILIDDSEANCTAFDDNGGMSILFRQPWNDQSFESIPVRHVASTIQMLRDGGLWGEL